MMLITDFCSCSLSVSERHLCNGNVKILKLPRKLQMLFETTANKVLLNGIHVFWKIHMFCNQKQSYMKDKKCEFL